MTEPYQTLRMLVAYDGFESGLRATRLYQRLLKRFERDFRFEVDFWRIEFFSIPAICERSASDAVRADLIVVAEGSRFGLPPAFHTWVEKWITRKTDHESALIHLSQSPEAGGDRAPSVGTYMQNIAARGRLTFISNAYQGLAATEEMTAGTETQRCPPGRYASEDSALARTPILGMRGDPSDRTDSFSPTFERLAPATRTP